MYYTRVLLHFRIIEMLRCVTQSLHGKTPCLQRLRGGSDAIRYSWCRRRWLRTSCRRLCVAEGSIQKNEIDIQMLPARLQSQLFPQTSKFHKEDRGACILNSNKYSQICDRLLFLILVTAVLNASSLCNTIKTVISKLKQDNFVKLKR